VVQINTHLTANDSADKIKKLAADKVSVEEKIKKLDEIIVKKRAEISTKKYESNIQKDKDKNELNSLITERTSETSLYNSIVNQIQSLASGSNTTKVTPKYRVRGFWAIPEPKKVADTVDQSVVQFIIQYRYLSTSGKASEVSQLPFTEGTRQKTAVFSNWNEMTTKARDRYRDDVSGKFAWQASLVEDAQEVNFNQLDMNSIIGANSLPMQTILNDSRLHTILLNLSKFDVMTLNFKALYYFAQEQQYYLLNKINFKNNEVKKSSVLKF